MFIIMLHHQHGAPFGLRFRDYDKAHELFQSLVVADHKTAEFDITDDFGQRVVKHKGTITTLQFMPVEGDMKAQSEIQAAVASYQAKAPSPGPTKEQSPNTLLQLVKPN
jgi:hypothetical protein